MARTKEETTAYNAAYRRGWAAEAYGSDGAMDRADSRNEPGAWYDGYTDSSAGNPKYHFRDCPLDLSPAGWCPERH